MNPVPWSKRTFDYGRSMDELPVLLERVQGTSARLSTLLARQPRENLHLRVHGKWSAMEHIGHLITLQDRFEPRVDDFEQRRPKLCDINLKDQDPIIQGHRLRSLGDVLEEFRIKRLAFANRIERLRQQSLEHIAYHPCQDRTMRPVDMLLWIAEHDDHHLASVRAILKDPLVAQRPSLWPD
ncbi:MAG: DinB family protein [Flavobacteriales bacterium]|nr:DinB family protein [Flavobacteriales bacterium]